MSTLLIRKNPSLLSTLLIRNSPSLEPYSRTMPRALWWSWGGEKKAYDFSKGGGDSDSD